MTAREDYLAGRLDRDAAKEKRTARTLQVREMAVAVINCAVMEQPEEDRACFMQEAINHLGTLYTASQGPEATISLFGKLSKCPTFDIRQAVARARAAQAFAKLAANDHTEGRVVK